MATKFRTLLAAAALALGSFGAHATVLDFEGLVTDPNFGLPFTSNYGGLKFGTNVPATNAWSYDDYVSFVPTFASFARSGKNYARSYPFQPDGTPFVGYTGAALEASQSITSAVAFVFSGAWFMGEGQIQYELYNGGNLVSTSAVSGALNENGYQFVDAAYSGFVDEIVIRGHQGFFFMDDLTIPEPSSLALVALAGLAGVGAARSRRQAAATAS